MSLRGVGWIVVTVMLAVGLLGAAAADAKKRHKKPKSPPVTVISNTQTASTDNQQLTVTASCPTGLIAVGGGFDAPPVISGGSLDAIDIVYESRRSGPSSWQVSVVRNSSASAPGEPVTASVDCRSPRLAARRPSGTKATAAKKKKSKKLRITEVTASGSAPGALGGPQGSATAVCPTGTQALGGGFSSSPPPDVSGSNSFGYFFADHRDTPTTWRAAFANQGPVARTVTSYAYCAPRLRIAEVNGSAPLPASGSTTASATAVTSPCTGGKALLGGGFINTPPASGSAIAFLTASNASGRSWQVGALNFNTIAGTLGARGYCA